MKFNFERDLQYFRERSDSNVFITTFLIIVAVIVSILKV